MVEFNELHPLVLHERELDTVRLEEFEFGNYRTFKIPDNQKRQELKSKIIEALEPKFLESKVTDDLKYVYRKLNENYSILISTLQSSNENDVLEYVIKNLKNLITHLKYSILRYWNIYEKLSEYWDLLFEYRHILDIIDILLLTI